MSNQFHAGSRAVAPGRGGRKRQAVAAAITAAALVGVAVSHAGASTVSLPFTDNFNAETTSTVQNTWTEASSGVNSLSPSTVWTVTTTGAISGNGFNDTENLTGSTTSTTPRDSASINTGLGNGQNWVESSQFVINAETNGNASSTRWGLTALGQGSGTFTNGYLADYYIDNSHGQIRIAETPPTMVTATLTGGGALTTTGGPLGNGTVPIVTGDQYLQTLSGTYAANGTLTITYSLQDQTAGSAALVDTQTDASPLTGTNFGFSGTDQGSGTNTAGGLINITMDNYSLTPEPSSLAVLSLGSVAMPARRRRLA